MTTEANLIAAHKAGRAYFHAHRMFDHMQTIALEELARVARSCGFHGRDCEAWLAGFDGERKRHAATFDCERPGGCGAAVNTLKQARDVVGPLGYPSKMPGTAYGISAKACITGAKLAKVEGSVCYGCYALKANYLYPSVAMAHETRLRGLESPAWVSGMVMMLNHAHKTGRGRNGPIATGWHRWHDSGDLQSVEHLAKVCEVATLTPHIRHWLPTRELSIVKAYEKAGGIVPVNLVIRVSATMVDGPAPKAWPNTSGVHDKREAQGRACPAPQQEGKCGDCRACWDPAVKHVSYHLH